jgi:hypothetical protein
VVPSISFSRAFASRSVRVLPCTVVLCAAVLGPALAGCGGDDDSAGGTGGTTTSAATMTQATQDERLTPAGWNEYTEVRDEARTVNNAAIVTFKKCRKVLYGSDERASPSMCFGDSLANLTGVGKDTLAFLTSQQADVGGACGKANAELTGYVKLYTASAQTLADSVAKDEVPRSPATIDNALVALDHTKAASVAFDAACKPAASA